MGPRRRRGRRRPVCFLSRTVPAITGEFLHVDGGFHAMAAPLA